jgi:cytochrome oxidase Cu insertion factor (SCO1/SenC/PrrC family)
MKQILSIFLFICTISALGQNKTRVSVEMKDTSMEKMALHLYRDINIDTTASFISDKKKNLFDFEFLLDKPAYFLLDIKSDAFNFLLAEPGDDIHILCSKDTILFTGKGAAKCEYTYKQWNRSLKWKNAFNWKMAKGDTLQLYNNYFSFLDSCRSVELGFLKGYRQAMGPTAFAVLKADLFGDIDHKKLLRVLSLFAPGNPNPGNKIIARKLYSENIVNASPEIIANDTTAVSRIYWNYLWQKTILDYGIMRSYTTQPPYSVKSYYQLVSALHSGLTKEKILTILLLTQMRIRGTDNDLVYCLKDYFATSNNKEYITILKTEYNRYKSELAAGEKAINFSLINPAGKKIQLTNFNNKVVVLDFWFYRCTGCIQMAKAMLPVKEQFANDPDVVFVNVSIDTEKDKWLKGVSEYHMDNGVNLYTEGKGQYHPVVKQYNVKGYPTLIVVGKNNILYSVHPPDPRQDGGKKLISLIREAQNNNSNFAKPVVQKDNDKKSE